MEEIKEIGVLDQFPATYYIRPILPSFNLKHLEQTYSGVSIPIFYTRLQESARILEVKPKKKPYRDFARYLVVLFTVCFSKR